MAPSPRSLDSRASQRQVGAYEFSSRQRLVAVESKSCVCISLCGICICACVPLSVVHKQHSVQLLIYSMRFWKTFWKSNAILQHATFVFAVVVSTRCCKRTSEKSGTCRKCPLSSEMYVLSQNCEMHDAAIGENTEDQQPECHSVSTNF